MFGIIIKNIEFESSWVKPCLYSLLGLGVMCTSFLKYYFLRQEEKACDLEAIKICESAKGANITFSTHINYTWHNLIDCQGDTWKIIEQRFKLQKQPLKKSPWWRSIFSTNTHPSNYERILYCKEYAKKRGYPY